MTFFHAAIGYVNALLVDHLLKFQGTGKFLLGSLRNVWPIFVLTFLLNG